MKPTDAQPPSGDHATCAETFVTLRIYSDSVPPAAVTTALGIDASKTQQRGEVRNPGGRQPVAVPLHGWFLSSEGNVVSRDARDHMDWLIVRLGSSAEAIRALKAKGCRAEVNCYWVSRSGHGGPMVTSAQMGALSQLGLDLDFDVYFEDDA